MVKPETNTVNQSRYGRAPLILIWEITQACDLSCAHCRIDQNKTRSPDELTTREGFSLLKQAAELGTKVIVLTGGDPLERQDIFQLIEYGTELGLKMCVIPATTRKLSRASLEQLKDAGCKRVAFSLDGPNAEIHDGIRGESNVFSQLLEAVDWAHELDLSLQINSVLSRKNIQNFDQLFARVQTLHPVFWEIFFLVPTGEGRTLGLPSPTETQHVFEKIYSAAQSALFGIKVTESPHYRRFCIEKKMEEWGVAPSTISERSQPLEKSSIHELFSKALAKHEHSAPETDEIWQGVRHRAWGINSGQGFVFVSHRGSILPSGFLPKSAGNIRNDSLRNLYRTSDLFQQLRDDEQLQGRCGECDFRRICGGSRSRAYALHDNPLADDPLCFYREDSAA